jgi:hypothetical protein
MGTCPGSPVLPCTDEVAPPSPAIFNPPSNLTATAVSSSQIDLSWQDNSDDELGFRIERKTGAESYTEIDTVLAGVENYPDTGLEPNTTYDYRVCAYNLAGDSDYAEDLETTPALGPGGCFIATAAYGTEAAVEIDVLRAFRDEVLLESALGSQLVDLYYRTSPPVADFISENSLLRTIVRELVVDPIVLVVEAMEALWRN